MKKVLITGANKSIGFETARQLLQQGYYVYLGSRSIERGAVGIKSNFKSISRREIKVVDTVQ